MVEVILMGFDRALRYSQTVCYLLAKKSVASQTGNLQLPRSKLDRRQFIVQGFDLLLEFLLHILTGKHQEAVRLKGLLYQNGILFLGQLRASPVE